GGPFPVACTRALSTRRPPFREASLRARRRGGRLLTAESRGGSEERDAHAKCALLNDVARARHAGVSSSPFVACRFTVVLDTITQYGVIMQYAMPPRLRRRGGR